MVGCSTEQPTYGTNCKESIYGIMKNTEHIYSQFKESIKSAVQTAKISTIAKNGRFNTDYLFVVESAEDKLYSKVIEELEWTACREVDILLYNLCIAYGYKAEIPCNPTGYDVLIDKHGEITKVELKTSPNLARPRLNRNSSHSGDITYVYLLKQTTNSYDLLARSTLNSNGCSEYLFADFIRILFGKEEMKKFNKSMLHFSEEMRDAIGYNVTQICNDRNLEDLRDQLRIDLLEFDYDKVRNDNDATGTYTEYINDNAYGIIKAEFHKNYSLLLGKGDFAISFLTSEWLYRHFSSVSQIDNTFIASGYFKSIEQLLWSIIFIVGNGRNIGRDNHIVGSNESGMDKTLGSLRYFLNDSANNDLYQSAFGNATRYVRQYLNRQLDIWISNSRNGYFHKDNMPANEVTEIREQTYYLYLLILGSLTLSDENIEILKN